MESISQHAPANAAQILVANKIDLEDRCVTKEEAEQLAKQFNLNYFECSAKANIGLAECFLDIFENSYKNKYFAK